MTGIFIKGIFGDRLTHRENTMGRLELCHKPRNYQMLGKRPRTDSSLEPSEGAWPCQHLDLTLPASRTVR